MKFSKLLWCQVMTDSFNVVNASYVATAVNTSQYPEGDLQEIAFIGRSNVGKSSLINSLCRRNGLARTSGTPGKTQTINYFRITGSRRMIRGSNSCLLICPGMVMLKERKHPVPLGRNLSRSIG